MSFKGFEQLEKFYLMTNKIEALQRDQNASSVKGNAPKKSGGIKIKNNGTYTRD